MEWLDSHLHLEEPNEEALLRLAESEEWKEVLKYVGLMRNRAFLTLFAGGAGVNRDILAAEAKAYDKIYTLLEALHREAREMFND